MSTEAAKNDSALAWHQVLEQEFEQVLLARERDAKARETSDPCKPATKSGSAGARTLTELHNDLHKLKPRLSALCLSGGGIRSASFSLGVVQGLAKRGLLEKFDYLSTVSGGGYLGGWLTAWIHRHKG